MAEAFARSRLMRVVYSVRRTYLLSCGVASLNDAKSFLNPPATMLRQIDLPCRNARLLTIFATVYGCIYTGCTATKGRSLVVCCSMICEVSQESTRELSVYTRLPVQPYCSLHRATWAMTPEKLPGE